MSWLTGWVRATFDYNPSFPLSALVLLGGLRLLAADGALDGSTVSGAGGALGILGAYELLLLGVALLVLWPRRIAYETTSILIIFSVVRFASPFAVIGLASEGEPLAAVLLGLGLTIAMTLKGEAIRQRVGLSLRPWERGFDYGLFALACLAFPLLGERLSVWTGDAISHQSARLLQLCAWWCLALLLIPLCLGLPSLGGGGPLRTRRPALVWRWLTAGGSISLLFSALWLGGGVPFPLALAPLTLVGLGLFRVSLSAAGVPLPRWIVHGPALLSAAALALPAGALFGGLPVVSHPVAALALFGLCAAFVPVLASAGERISALRSLGATLALAPLRFAPSLLYAQSYVLVGTLCVLALGLLRRKDGLTAGAALFSAAGAAHLLGRLAGFEAAVQGVLAGGALLALLVGWRIPPALGRARTSASLAVAAGLCVLPALLLASSELGADTVWLAAVSGLGLALGGRLQRSAGVAWTGGGQAILLVGHRAVGQVAPGVALIALGFFAIPAGTAVALRRERRERLEQVAEAQSPGALRVGGVVA